MLFRSAPSPGATQARAGQGRPASLVPQEETHSPLLLGSDIESMQELADASFLELGLIWGGYCQRPGADLRANVTASYPRAAPGSLCKVTFHLPAGLDLACVAVARGEPRSLCKRKEGALAWGFPRQLPLDTLGGFGHIRASPGLGFPICHG